MKRVALLLIVFTTFLSANSFFKKVSASEYSLTIFVGDNKYIYYYPEIYLKEGTYYLRDKEGKIDRIVRDSYEFARNARVIASSIKDVKIIPEKIGKRVDGNFLSTQIDTALKRGESKINAIFKYVYPEVTSAYVNRCLYKRGSFTTNLGFSSAERRQNILLACSKINGTILFSGEEFSFNKVVGKRTQENGYKNAKVIKDGQFIEGVGGGVCQVSTTLYNSVLLSGLKVSEYHPHSLAVGYVEKSFDAMVTDLWADLRFINNTNGLLFLFASVENDLLNISICGTEQKYSYKRESVIEEEIFPEDKIELVGGLLKGERVKKVIGKSGFKSKGYLCKYYKGVLVEKELIRVDEYKKIDNLILQGG